MNPTILVVDGRGAPRLLQQSLSSQGYDCLYARGPLKVRALLNEAKVDLILWKDNKAAVALNEDLFEEWARHPAVPVIRLFAKDPPIGNGALPPQIIANLPAELPETHIHGAIERALGPPNLAAAAPSELAFRGLVTQLREDPLPAPGLVAQPQPQRDERALMSVGSGERELLREVAPSAASGFSTEVSPLRRLLDWLVPSRMFTRPMAASGPAAP